MSEAGPPPNNTDEPAAAAAGLPQRVGFVRALRYFLRLGTTGFGGPIATVGYMQRDLVERRGWIDRRDFLDGVALGQTCPTACGAVAMWVGYLRKGATGAVAVALAFIAPSFSIVVAVGALYVQYSGLPVVQSLFYGIAPAVMAIITVAAVKLLKLTDPPRLAAVSSGDSKSANSTSAGRERTRRPHPLKSAPQGVWGRGAVVAALVLLAALSLPTSTDTDPARPRPRVVQPRLRWIHGAAGFDVAGGTVSAGQCTAQGSENQAAYQACPGMRGDGMGGFTLEAIAVTRGPVRLLDGVSGCVEAGRCTAVVGPSGAGKSTLLRVLNRLEDPTEGRVLLGGTPIGEMDVLGLRRRVGLVTQRPVLLTDRVADELRVGRGNLSAEQSSTLLQRVGLPAEFTTRDTAELSGGEAQRLCLARALAVEPEVLLLDEPTSALDGLTARLIADLAGDHVTSGGTVVLVSHDLAVVRRVAHHVLVLRGGRLIASGRPREIEYLEAG